MKTCTKCKVMKPLDEFHKAAREKDGTAASCKACRHAYYAANAEKANATSRAYYAANRGRVLAQKRAASQEDPDKRRDQKLRSTYGLSLKDFNSLLVAQGGACAICGTDRCTSGKAFAVDHDHACCPGSRSCGTCVRGLLCGNCNTALGKFHDSPARLAAAAAYLTRPGISLPSGRSTKGEQSEHP